MTKRKRNRPTVRRLGSAVALYLNGLDKATKTVRTTGSALNRLTDLVGADLLVTDLRADDLIDYRLSLKDDDLAYGTTSTYMRMTVPFFKWLILRDMAGFSRNDLDRALEVIAGMNGRKPQPLPKLPKEDTVTAVLKLAEEKTRVPFDQTDRQIWTALRNVAMLHTLRVTGVRAQELMDLTIGDLVLLVEPGEDEYAIVKGKGDKQRYVFFDDEALRWLRQWVLEHPDGRPEAPLFLRLDRRAPRWDQAWMSTESLRVTLRDMCKEAGHNPIHPHQFRHRFGTAVYVAAGLGPAADLMGHASTDTTRTYAKLARKQMKGAHRKADL